MFLDFINFAMMGRKEKGVGFEVSQQDFLGGQNHFSIKPENVKVFFTLL